jgi:drug/metabolite transporter (DMT)-like permease
MWGIFDGEKIAVWQFLWIGLIFVGVYLVNKRKRE